MAIEIIEIGRDDTGRHAPFFRHVAENFDGIDFRLWAKVGGWSDGYRVTALLEDEKLVSTVAVTRMQFVLHSGHGQVHTQTLSGLQLGAVATRGDRRGKGHARVLMQHVLAAADRRHMPVLLFANPLVAHFYPRFGFQRLRPQRLAMSGAFAPSGASVRLLDPTRAEDVRLLSDVCVRSAPHGGALSAAPGPSIPLWYLCNGLARAFVLDGGRSIVFATEADGTLRVQDWLGELPGDPLPALRSVLRAPVARVEFGFLPPCGWLPGELQAETDDDALMYWRGDPVPAGPLLFPELLTT